MVKAQLARRGSRFRLPPPRLGRMRRRAVLRLLPDRWPAPDNRLPTATRTASREAIHLGSESSDDAHRPQASQVDGTVGRVVESGRMHWRLELARKTDDPSALPAMALRSLAHLEHGLANSRPVCAASVLDHYSMRGHRMASDLRRRSHRDHRLTDDLLRPASPGRARAVREESDARDSSPATNLAAPNNVRNQTGAGSRRPRLRNSSMRQLDRRKESAPALESCVNDRQAGASPWHKWAANRQATQTTTHSNVDNSPPRVLAHPHCATTAYSSRNSMVDPQPPFPHIVSSVLSSKGMSLRPI